MKIPDKIKKSILADKKQLSVNQISKKYNLPRIEIKKIIEASDRKPRKWFFAVMILIPVLFFVLLELFLRIINYGEDIPQWIDVGGGKYVINPELSKKYFYNTEFISKTNEDFFDQQKKANTFRVFILGGSSAAGYPYMPMGSFSRYIRKRMELVYPNTNIEVVNLSMTGVNTYTLLDIFPGILEQNPDLILIYAGHNEYYGALGIGSVESFGTSRNIVNLVLYLNKYRVIQLIRSSISWISSLFESENKNIHSGTLMSRMAKDQYIKLNSEKFNAGIKQFSGNLEDILKAAKIKGVPVIVGRLACNLKDQKPFISINTPNYKTANQVYDEAQRVLKKNDIPKADSLFRLAKDLDALRFRAPERINAVINNLSKEFNAEIVPIDSLFDQASPNGIVGNNLMVDHLHLNLRGYQLLGRFFYETMERSGNLPKMETPKIPFNIQDSVTLVNFMFTELDSVIGNNIVTLLKNDWPFVKEPTNVANLNLFQKKNFIDSLAIGYIENTISWEDAHLNAATRYLRKDDINNYLKYMNILIYQYPYLKDINTAVKYYYKKNKVNPSDYNTRRLGLIAFYSSEYDDAIKLLTESHNSNPQDKEVSYNLAKAYYYKKDFISALNIINNYLYSHPNDLSAKRLKQDLLSEIKG